jgi:tetratricopeptide (TPR) repeat protein
VTRPARRKILALALVIGGIALASALSGVGKLALAAILLAVSLTGYLLGRDFFRGRAAHASRSYLEAIAHYRRFLAQCERPPRSMLRFLWLGLYTSDVAALAENNIGACLLEIGEGAEATATLEHALARDPGYAVPHVNLAILASLAGDRERADRHRDHALRLGYSSALLDRAIRGAIARANVAVGRVV